jgi:hypothetical protein
MADRLAAVLAMGGLLCACTGEITPIDGDTPQPIAVEPAERLLGTSTILGHARSAGVPCDRLVVAGALALAESGGYTNATHTNPASGDCPSGSTDRGLWQINDCYWENYSDACAFDPGCNAKAMAEISNYGESFALWRAFTNDSYESHLEDARAAFDSGIAGCSEAAPPKSADTCSGLGYAGTCVGDTSIWWENGGCRLRDCASEGRSCALISDSIGWGCLGGTTSATTSSCVELGRAGQCNDDATLVWFEDGECRWTHCPDSGRGCGDDGANGMNCVE